MLLVNSRGTSESKLYTVWLLILEQLFTFLEVWSMCMLNNEAEAFALSPSAYVDCVL